MPDPISIGSALIGSSIIGGIGSLVGGLFGSSSAKKQSQREMEFNSAQAQLNRNFQKSERLATQSYNTTMWNLNNEYNEKMLADQRAYDSPKAQLERAMAAGINPNAVVGGLDNGSVNFAPASPVSSTPSNGSSASYSSGLPSALVGSQAQYLSAFANAASSIANARKENAEADQLQVKTDFDKASFGERLRAVNANTDKVLRETKNIDFTEEQTRKINEWVASHTSAQIDEINKKLLLLDNQIALEAEKVISEQKNQNLIDSQIDVNEADESYKDIQTKVYDEIYNQEKVKTAFAQVTEIPVGSSDWHAMYKLWKERKFADVTKVSLYGSSDQYNRGLSSVVSRVEHIKESTLDKIKSLYDSGRNMISIFNPSDYFSSDYFGRSFGRSQR